MYMAALAISTVYLCTEVHKYKQQAEESHSATWRRHGYCWIPLWSRTQHKSQCFKEIVSVFGYSHLSACSFCAHADLLHALLVLCSFTHMLFLSTYFFNKCSMAVKSLPNLLPNLLACTFRQDPLKGSFWLLACLVNLVRADSELIRQTFPTTASSSHSSCFSVFLPVCWGAWEATSFWCQGYQQFDFE